MTAPSRQNPPTSAPPGSEPPVIATVERAQILRWLALGLGVVGTVGLVILFLFNPSNHSFYPFCVFYRVSGWQCPGCGGLRAVHHLLHGELLTAFRFNPLVVTAAPVGLFFLLRRWWRGPGREKASHRTQARRAWLVFAVLVIFWILRNLPLEMFRLPAG
jgi:hypothetical protein